MKSKAEHSAAPHWRRIGISWKLMWYLILFTVLILAVVWIFQIVLLNYFYRESQYRNMDTIDDSLTDIILQSPEDIKDTVMICSENYTTCIRVFGLRWNDGLGYAENLASSADVCHDCLIHGVNEAYLTHLYTMAKENGHAYTILVDADEWESRTMEKDISPKELSGRRKLHRILSGGILLRARLVEAQDRDGNSLTYMILINAELAPLSTTIQTLKTQFWVISVILLCCAIITAVMVSRNLARPIKKMSRAARQLAKGRYDADFHVTGYREAVELADGLILASTELSKNDALQKELIANISHDLRTPLTMIIGYSEVMRDIPGENTPENVQVIIDETQRLAGLVNDLLDLSKLQAGTRKPTMERFDLTGTAESVMQRYEKLTQKDGYRVEFNYDTHVDVMADRTMILQVIYNLTNNAINYAGEDKRVIVTQQVLTQTQPKEPLRVRISITDYGAGIAPDQIPLIWDRYYKVDKIHRRAMIGTGLGLSIVKHILELHETTYGVESKLGEGSTFWFELPVCEGEDE